MLEEFIPTVKHAAVAIRYGCLWNFMFQQSDAFHALQKHLVSDATYASLHLRLGDVFLGAGQNFRMNLQEQLVVDAIGCALATTQAHCPRCSKLVVLSDSLSVKKWVANPSWVDNSFPNSTIVVTTTLNKSGAVSKPTHSEPGRGATKIGVMESWADMSIIARSTVAIQTSGGFAESAAAIGLVPVRREFRAEGKQCNVVSGGTTNPLSVFPR